MNSILQALNQGWMLLGEMAPYLLFGFLVAGLLSVFLTEKTIERHMGGKGFLPVFKATVFGIPLPLCSCGVIPVAASLSNRGASRAATTSFLLSTPQTGADSILVTYSLLGPLFAIVRPVAAFAAGVLGGGVVAVLDKSNGTGPQADREPVRAGRGKIREAFLHAFDTLPRSIGKPLLLGLVIAGLIAVFVPKDFFATAIGTGFTQKLLMMLVGMPLYVCATASVPVAAALMIKGISPGAALVFLMTGPATNAATFTTVWKVIGGRATVIYLSTVAFIALVSGVLLDTLASGMPYLIHAPSAEMISPLWRNTAAALLLTVIFSSLFKVPERIKGMLGNGQEKHGGNESKYRIEGMNCEHCVSSVKDAISGCNGVSSVDVNLKNSLARVYGTPAEWAVEQAVESAGYKAHRLEDDSMDVCCTNCGQSS